MAKLSYLSSSETRALLCKYFDKVITNTNSLPPLPLACWRRVCWQLQVCPFLPDEGTDPLSSTQYYVVGKGLW